MSIDSCGVENPGLGHATVESTGCLPPVASCQSVCPVSEPVEPQACDCSDPIPTDDPTSDPVDETSCMDAMTKILEVVMAVVTALAPVLSQSGQTSSGAGTPPINPNSGQ